MAEEDPIIGRWATCGGCGKRVVVYKKLVPGQPDYLGRRPWETVERCGACLLVGLEARRGACDECYQETTVYRVREGEGATFYLEKWCCARDAALHFDQEAYEQGVAESGMRAYRYEMDMEDPDDPNDGINRAYERDIARGLRRRLGR